MTDLRDRLRGALWGIFIGDALSMPVHWFYDPRDIQSLFGSIRSYQPCPPQHPSSIMHVSNTGGHGRGSNEGNVIGGVILHDKKQYWGGNPRQHYHHGMKAGENTLNALCARVLIRSMTKSREYNADLFLEDYIQFMTTKGSHNDCYAESYHRDFFKNWSLGKQPRQCAGKEDHNTASMGGFVMLPPVILAHYKNPTLAQQQTLFHLSLTHQSVSLSHSASVYVDLLLNVLNGMKLREAVQLAGSKLVPSVNVEAIVAKQPKDTQVIGSLFSPACYISDSFPALLYLAYKYADDFEEALFANTNVGGENCHRGSALGALMGVAFGYQRIPSSLIQGLYASKELDHEINSFLDTFL